MTTANLLKSLLVAALLICAAAHAADDKVTVTVENGKQQAAFKLGDSRCILVDDKIRCSSIVVAENDR